MKKNKTKVINEIDGEGYTIDDPTEECFRLNPILQQELDRIYNKWKSKCAFGKFQKERAYHTIIYHALQIVDCKIQTEHEREKEMKK